MKYKLWWLPNQEFDGTEESIGIFNSHADAIKDIINFFDKKELLFLILGNGKNKIQTLFL